MKPLSPAAAIYELERFGSSLDVLGHLSDRLQAIDDVSPLSSNILALNSTTGPSAFPTNKSLICRSPGESGFTQFPHNG